MCVRVYSSINLDLLTITLSFINYKYLHNTDSISYFCSGNSSRQFKTFSIMIKIKITDKPFRLPRSVFFENNDGVGLSLPLRFTLKSFRAYIRLVLSGFHYIEVWK